MKKQISSSVIILVFFALVWITEFCGKNYGYQEVCVKTKDDKAIFETSFETISHIVVCADDGKASSEDIRNAYILITITDEINQYKLECSGISIHRNGYTSAESSTFDGLPLSLVKGHKYNFQYLLINQMIIN